MKKITLLIIVSLVLIVISCSNQDSKNTNSTQNTSSDPTTNGTQTNTGNSQTVSIDVTNKNDNPKTDPLKTDPNAPLRPDEILNQAIQGNDPQICNQIKDTNKAEECLKRANEAISGNDNNKAEKEIAENDKITREAVESGDKTKCDQIIDSAIKENCYVSVISKKAANTKNKKLCKEIEEEIEQKQCESQEAFMNPPKQ